eukprot:TRINITY_DN5536_c0_g1_i1.p1 TRINITY_DN5536_c0_g1~~TRINITY_DN5536_c0_g1_i1.p1  ORF type:complete len:397 (+),score=38.76 TRINITY_DN5536_c0_g1_i1:32-1192(+)
MMNYLTKKESIMATYELTSVRKKILEETDDLYAKVSAIATKKETNKNDIDSILQMVLSFKNSMSSIIEDKFSDVPREVLDIVISNSEIDEVKSLSRVCKRFYHSIHNENYWKEWCIMWWKNTIPEYPVTDLIWIKETAKIFRWKTIVKHLSNPDLGKYTHELRDENCLCLYRWDDETMITAKSFVFQPETEDDPPHLFIGDVVQGGIGKGKRIWIDGSYDQGHFVKWHLNGRVERKFAVGYHYIGFCIDDYYNGQGTLIYKNGSIYIGTWHQGSRHGDGEMKWLSGYSYDGDWSQDKPSNADEVIDPLIQNSINKNKCTIDVSHELYTLPQLLFSCSQCKIAFCETCTKNCHQCDQNQISKEWDDANCCGCEKLECKRESKRLKIS